MEIRELLAQVHNDLSNGAVFIKKSDATARSTGDNAFWAVNLNEATFTDEDLKMADLALAHARAYNGDNTFLKSLARVAGWDTISPKQVDRAAWIMQKYLTRDESVDQGLPEGFGSSSAFVGHVADKEKGESPEEIFFRATVAQVRLYRDRRGYKGPGPNGEKQLVTFQDAQGNVLTYFPSTKILPLAQGQGVKVRAFVKAHQTYKGVNQTVITRCTIVPA